VEIIIPLPVEPLYTLSTVTTLVPMTRDALDKWLVRYKKKLGPPLYKSHQGRRFRFLRASDVVIIRNHLFSTVRFPSRRADAPQADQPTTDRTGQDSAT